MKLSHLRFHLKVNVLTAPDRNRIKSTISAAEGYDIEVTHLGVVARRKNLPDQWFPLSACEAGTVLPAAPVTAEYVGTPKAEPANTAAKASKAKSAPKVE